MGRAGSQGSSRGDLAALWGPSQELAMQGSWESLAALLGNPLPLPLDSLPMDPLPFPEGPPPPNSSGSSMERPLAVRSSYSSLPAPAIIVSCATRRIYHETNVSAPPGLAVT